MRRVSCMAGALALWTAGGPAAPGEDAVPPPPSASGEQPVMACKADEAGRLSDCELLVQPPGEPERRFLTTEDFEWAKLPTGQDMADLFPEEGWRHGLSGRALTVCRIGGDLKPQDCQLVLESPEHRGFGEAALRLMEKFRAKGHTTSGETTVGAYVLTPVILKMNGQPPPAANFGFDAYLLAPGAPDGPQSVACGDQRCSLEAVKWVRQPYISAVAPRLTAIAPQEGLSIVQCQVGSEGALTACKASGVGSAQVHAVLFALAAEFVAPTDAAGRPALVLFQWEQLGPIAAKLTP